MSRIFRILMLSSLISTVMAQQSPPASSTDGPPNPAQPKGLATRPAEAPEDRDTSGKKLQKITLDVVVTDAAGNPVQGLMKSDFTILENDQPKPVLSFAAIDGQARPDTLVQAILLIDTVSNSFESIAQERRGIEMFLERNGGHLPFPVSIVLFSDSGAKVDQPSTDGNLLIAELRKTFTAVPTLNSAMGGEGSIERFQRSLKVLTQLTTYLGAQPGRKLLLWIGPGWPMLAGSHFGSSEKDKHADWSGIVSFSTYLRQSRTTLYSVDTLSSGASVAHGVYYRTFSSRSCGLNRRSRQTWPFRCLRSKAADV